MFGQFYSGMRWTALPVFALILFLATFLAVVVRTLLPAKRAELERLARLPLGREDAELRQQAPRSRGRQRRPS